MGFTIPNIESSPSYDGQSVPDATDWAAVAATDAGNGVITGLAVTSTGTLGLGISAGQYTIGPNVYTYAGGTGVVSTASATDRKDIVTINAAGSITVTAGAASGTLGWTRASTANAPVKPAIPSGGVLLAEIYVPGTAASISSGNIIDKRVTSTTRTEVTFTRQAGFPVTGTTTGAITIANVGDVMMVGVVTGVSGITPYQNYPCQMTDTSSRVTWDTAPVAMFPSPGGSESITIWKGVSASTGTTTVTPLWSGTATSPKVIVDEMKPSAGTIFSVGVGPTGLPSVNTVDTSKASAGTAVTFPSLLAPVNGGLYWGFLFGSAAMVAGSTSGFTYTLGSGSNNLLAENPGLTPGQTYAPTATMTSGFYLGAAAVIVAQ